VIESWLKAIRDHPDRPSATERVVLECLALRLNWTTGKGFCSVQQLMEDAPAAKRSVLRALEWAQSDTVTILKQTRRGGRKGDGSVLASEWALIVPVSQGAISDPLRTIVKVPNSEPQGATWEPPSRPVNHQDLKGGDKSRVSRPARPAVERTEDEQIAIVRRAVEDCGWDNRELNDEYALDIYARFITERKSGPPRNPVAYLYSAKNGTGIFASFDSLDGVMSNTPERDVF
jgi:hypothetical protein